LTDFGSGMVWWGEAFHGPLEVPPGLGLIRFAELITGAGSGPGRPSVTSEHCTIGGRDRLLEDLTVEVISIELWP
jgi:hypothetical protein